MFSLAVFFTWALIESVFLKPYRIKEEKLRKESLISKPKRKKNKTRQKLSAKENIERQKSNIKQVEILTDDSLKSSSSLKKSLENSEENFNLKKKDSKRFKRNNNLQKNRVNIKNAKILELIKKESRELTKKTCLKTIKATSLFESGPAMYGGTLPNYVYEPLINGEVRVNCLTDGDIFLRNDGALFHIQPNWGFMPEHVHPDDKEKERIIDDLNFKYQGCEYVLDDFCPDIKNIWRVIIAVKRTGRCCYGNKKNELKKAMIEGNANWVYWKFLDQFTPESEIRFRQKLKNAQKRKKEREKWERENPPQQINFEFDEEFWRNYFKNQAEIESYGNIDCFKILGVSKDVSLSDLKKAYWNLAKQYHPDLNPNNEDAKKRFIEINDAYQILSDPEKRSYL